MKTSDQELIQLYLKGREDALELLIRKYLKPIYGYVFRFVQNQQDAEDLTQEIFLKMWRNLKKFKKGKSFKSWLFKIAKNTCFDFLRKKKGNLALNLENLDILADFAPSLIEEVEKENWIEKIKKGIEKLPLKMQKVLDLYYNLGLNFREISEVLGEPVNTIKSRHRRAIYRLKKSIFQ
jgi:RNA polymerase sigma-70 factor (ECF subfamily)